SIYGKQVSFQLLPRIPDIVCAPNYYTGGPLFQGLKDIADNLSSTKMIGDASGRDLIDNPYNKPRSVTRTSSIKLAIPGI
ncbi:hypothetical protein AKJ16_DCAP16916, partial [Drosera capensis]